MAATKQLFQCRGLTSIFTIGDSFRLFVADGYHVDDRLAEPVEQEYVVQHGVVIAADFARSLPQPRGDQVYVLCDVTGVQMDKEIASVSVF